MAEVKLFGAWFSPFSRRVEMALQLKGVQYEYVEEDLSNKSDLLLKLNPVHKKIPVLLHNGKVIAESSVILQYIDEAFDGPAILPKDPYDRAMARFFAKFINEKCLAAAWKACLSTGEEKEKLREEAIELFKFLDNELKGKKFFGGDTIGFVDLCANSVGYGHGIMAELTETEIMTKENHPNLCQWTEDYVHNDVVKKNLPEKEKLAGFFKAQTKPRVGNEYRPRVE